ncbi:MAG: prepilin-type N-terminal cleavage/methylation domain-containing protein [Tissierella sp.]|uniref:prepilin-type N-terminal cleavage/methylation domain-containing protein n=1 Tax=Tissierella sp. TaxID=41274 RepID=UPI003F9D0454
MRVINCKKNFSNDNKGFTLIEVIIVIAIILILSLILLPNYLSYRDDAKERVCNINSIEFERSYHLYLVDEGIDHTDSMFTKYLIEQDIKICPENGEISYVNNKVKCSIHDKEKEDNDVLYI